MRWPNRHARVNTDYTSVFSSSSDHADMTKPAVGPPLPASHLVEPRAPLLSVAVTTTTAAAATTTPTAHTGSDAPSATEARLIMWTGVLVLLGGGLFLFWGYHHLTNLEAKRTRSEARRRREKELYERGIEQGRQAAEDAARDRAPLFAKPPPNASTSPGSGGEGGGCERGGGKPHALVTNVSRKLFALGSMPRGLVPTVAGVPAGGRSGGGGGGGGFYSSMGSSSSNGVDSSISSHNMYVPVAT